MKENALTSTLTNVSNDSFQQPPVDQLEAHAASRGFRGKSAQSCDDPLQPHNLCHGGRALQDLSPDAGSLERADLHLVNTTAQTDKRPGY